MIASYDYDVSSLEAALLVFLSPGLPSSSLFCQLHLLHCLRTDPLVSALFTLSRVPSSCLIHALHAEPFALPRIPVRHNISRPESAASPHSFPHCFHRISLHSYPPMTQTLAKDVGVSLAIPSITSMAGHEKYGWTKPHLSLDGIVSAASPLYSPSSPRSPLAGLPIYSRFTSRPSRWKTTRTAMKVRVSGPAPKGSSAEPRDPGVKEVTNWDGLSMVRATVSFLVEIYIQEFKHNP